MWGNSNIKSQDLKCVNVSRMRTDHGEPQTLSSADFHIHNKLGSKMCPQSSLLCPCSFHSNLCSYKSLGRMAFRREQRGRDRGDKWKGSTRQPINMAVFTAEGKLRGSVPFPEEVEIYL